MSTAIGDDAAIQTFWNWFSHNERRISRDYLDNAVHDELDRQLSAFGPVTWEIGPGRNTECSLVISPDGDSELFELTRRIVACAPALPDWEFYPARQPKAEGLHLDVIHEGKKVTVDAAKWRYVLYEYEDSTYDVVIEAPNLSSFEPGLQATTASLVLDNLIGEDRRIHAIGGIEVVTALDPSMNDKASDIQSLAAHLFRQSNDR